MKRASDTKVMLGSVVAAGAVLLVGAFTATAMLRSPAGAAPIAASPPAPSTPGSGGAVDPESSGKPSAATEPIAAPRQATALTADVPELSPQVLVMAAEHAPFDPERQAPVGRYLFPEERVTPAPPPEPEPPPTPPFRVVGAIAGLTGATPGAPGGIAVVQADGQQPKMLNVGEVFMDFRISSVEKDAVVVSNRGWDVSLPVEQLQATRIASGARNNNARNQNQRATNAQREAERVLEQMRERLEGLAGQFQGDLRIDQGNGQFRFQMQDGRAIIQGPNGQRTEIAIPGRGGGGAGEVPLDIQKIIVAPGGRVARPGGGGQ
jgi:hypothetical protein